MKIKLLLPFVLILLGAAQAQAQSTTVSGTVTDAGAQSWNSGTFTITFVPNQSYQPQPQYVWAGGALTTTFTGTLSGTGTYSLSLPSNSAISPQGSTWNFQFCPLASSTCFNAGNITVTGSTQTVNATPPVISISLTGTSSPSTRVYSTTEIAAAPLGAQVFLIGAGPQVCTVVSGNTCTTWVSVGSGSTSFPVGVVSPTQSPYNAKFNVHEAFDCSVTNTQFTINCPDGNFTVTANAGGTQHIFCTGTSPINSASASQFGTITAINSGTQITSSSANTATVAAGLICAWGDDDTDGADALNSSWNAAANIANNTGAPITYQLPAGITFTHKCLWNNITSNANYFETPTIKGSGAGSSKIIITPLISQGGTFDLTTCPTANFSNLPSMFGPNSATQNLSMSRVTFDGLGNPVTGVDFVGRSIVGAGNSPNPTGLSLYDHINIIGFGNASSNLFGIRTNGPNSHYYDIFSDGAGQTSCLYETPGNGSQQIPTILVENMFCGDSKSGGSACAIAHSGVYVNDIGSVYGGNCLIPLQVGGTAVYNGFGVSNLDQGASGTVGIQCIVTSTCNLTDSNFDMHSITNGIGCLIQNTATLHLNNTTCKGNASGSGLSLAAGTSYFDECGNSLPTPNTISGNVFGSCSVTGTTQVAGNFADGAGIGTSTFGSITGNSLHGQVTVTYAGTLATPATWTMTFPTTFLIAPACTVTDVGGTNPFPTQIDTTATPPTTTTLTVKLTFAAAPVATNTDIFVWNCGN